MGRKSSIITIVIITAILFIVFVRIFIQRDTRATQASRLEFYTGFLKTQQSHAINAYQKTALFTQNQINSDSTCIQLLKQLGATNSTEKKQELIGLLRQNTSLLAANIATAGFSFFQIQVPEKSSYLELFEKQLPSRSMIQGFVINEALLGYLFVFPCYFQEEIVALVEIGLDFHSLQQYLHSIDPTIQTGFLISGNTAGLAPLLLFNNEFRTTSLSDNTWINHDFIVPDNIRGTDHLLANIRQQLANSEKEPDFSVHFKTRHEAAALSFSRFHSFDKELSVYLLAVNNDHILMKAREMNDAIFIINVIIVMLAMFGIGYLVLNRISIMRQNEAISQSEQKLIELNQTKDKFFSIVAHDLKNPFNGIMGLSSYLVSDFDQVDDEEKKEVINDINIASKNAFNLLQNLLEWTRTQSGTIKNNPVMIDAANMVELALETVENLAKSKEIIIEEKYLSNEAGYADENLVATVIRNLVTNAIKFSPRGSTIKIIVNKYQDELYFCIRDHGIGLRSEEIDQLFRIDVNFHRKGTEKETGTGLGLKICKEFVEYFGGRIWVVSEPGKGSSFYFTVPVFKDI